MAADRLEEAVLLDGFDALGTDAQAKRPAEMHDRMDEDRRLAGRFHVFEKGAIDLDLVEGDAAQIDQARIAGAEIVERQADAMGAQVHHRGLGGIGILDHDAFGQFQLEPLGVEAGLVEDADHARDEVLVAELDRRDVDRELDPRPLPGLLAGAAQHPLAQRHDQAALLGDADEFGWRDHAVLGMRPAHQRLDPDNAGAVDRDLRLEVQQQLVAGDGVAQILLDHALEMQRPVHLRLEEGIAVPALVLGLIERGVGEAQQRAAVGAVTRSVGDADRAADADGDAADLEGLSQRVEDALAERRAGVRRLHMGLDDAELVAAETGDRVAETQDRGQALGDLADQLVAGIVTIGVVDGLEAVEVEQQHGEAALGSAELGDLLVEAQVEGAAVGQA